MKAILNFYPVKGESNYLCGCLRRLYQKTTTASCSIVVFAISLCACSISTFDPASSKTLPAFDPANFQSGEIFEINPEQSYLHLYVYRAGALATLGHNHVIAARDIEGRIYRHAELEKSGIVLALPVASFDVDEPGLRKNAGDAFETELSLQDKMDTYDNMLGKQVLNAGEYPEISIVSVSVTGSLMELSALLRINVAGRVNDIKIQATAVQESGRIVITGHATIKQSDFGILPISILMGALSVRDELDTDFRFVAESMLTR